MKNTKPEVTFTCNKRKMAKIEDLDHEIRETLKKIQQGVGHDIDKRQKQME